MGLNGRHSMPSVLEEYRRETQDILRKIGQEINFPKGTQLRSRDLYYLLHGSCSLCIEGENGKDMAVVYFMPGRIINFLPALCSFYPTNRDYPMDVVANNEFFVRAISDCRLLHIDHKKFLEIYFSSLPLHCLIIHGLVENCYALFSHLFSSMQKPSWQRVASLCLHMMSKDEPHYLHRRVTYAEISTFLSIPPVTVAKIFKALISRVSTR